MSDSIHVQESDDVGASIQDAHDTPQYHRVEATETMKKMVSGSMRDMLTGYPLLASFASSDAVFYHAISDKDAPIALTDGAAIYFNTAKDGWFDGSKWNADERVFVHAHEVVHLMHGEGDRALCCCCCCCCVDLPAREGDRAPFAGSTLVGSFELSSVAVGSFKSSTVTCEAAVGSLEPTAPEGSASR